MRRHDQSAAVCSVMAILAGSLANAQAVISIDPTTETTSTGTVVTVDVEIANVSDLYGYQLDLTFDPSILRAVSSTEGTFLSSGGDTFFIPGTNDNVGGTILNDEMGPRSSLGSQSSESGMSWWISARPT